MWSDNMNSFFLNQKLQTKISLIQSFHILGQHFIGYKIEIIYSNLTESISKIIKFKEVYICQTFVYEILALI